MTRISLLASLLFTLVTPAMAQPATTTVPGQLFTYPLAISGIVNFPNSDLTLGGSSTGITTFSSANSSVSNFTLTFPAITDTVTTNTATQTLTNKTLTAPTINGGALSGIFSGNHTLSGTVNVSGTLQIGGTTLALPVTPANGGLGANESTATGVVQFSSGTSSVNTALANGTTATTQSTGDNSTKLATTAFVASTFASPPALGATAPAAVSSTTLSASSTITFSGLSTGTCSNSLSLNSSNHAILAPCSVSGPASATASDIVTYNGTTGKIIQDQSAIATGQDLYIGGGAPWADVKSGANGCAAATGNGSTNDQAAIQCQINFMGTTFGGGVVYFPCGTYISNSTITVAYPVRLVGEGRACTNVETSSNITLLQVQSLSQQIHFAGFRDISFFCQQSSAATADCVEIDNCIDCTWETFQINGGNFALHICGSCGSPGGFGSGGDSTYRNALISGWGTNGGAIFQEDSGNWFYDIKADTVGQTMKWSLFMTTNLGATDLEENAFFRIDLQSVNGVWINDTGGGQNTVATFFHPIGWHAVNNLGTLSDLMLDGAEIVGGFTVLKGNLTVANSHGIGGTFGLAVTTGGCHNAANVNLTNGGTCTSP